MRPQVCRVLVLQVGSIKSENGFTVLCINPGTLNNTVLNDQRGLEASHKKII